MNTYLKINQYKTILSITGNVINVDVIIDTEDVERLSRHSWYVAIPSCVYTKSRNKIISKNLYIRAKINSKSEKLHRFILDVLKEKVIIDHIDGNTLNNRKSNLRIVTASENGLNRKRINKNNISGTQGVYYSKVKNTWFASIKVNGKKYVKSFSETVHGANAKNLAIEARKALVKTFNDQPKGVLHKFMVRETGDSEDMV